MQESPSRSTAIDSIYTDEAGAIAMNTQSDYVFHELEVSASDCLECGVRELLKMQFKEQG